MKNNLLPGKKNLILLIFMIPLLLGSSKLTDNSDERFSLINYTVFTPGSDVRINLYSASKSNNYHLRLFKVNDVEDFFTRIGMDRSRYNFDVWGTGNVFLLRYAKLIKDWQSTVDEPENYRSDMNLKVGKIDKPGYYILQALKGEQVAYCGIVVSNLAMVYKNSGRQILAFVSNSSSGDIMKNVKYSLYNKNNILSRRNSDKDGLAVFNINDTLNFSNQSSLLVAKTPKETVLSNPYIYFGTEENYYTAYVYTNQPVYRPGQKVYFKAIMRKKVGNEFKNLPGEEFSVTIKSPKNRDVYSGNLKTNEFGSLSGKFDLDNAADLGSYSISLSKDNMSYFGSFEVQEYKKPEYFVKVETNKKQYAAGDSIGVNISANYYFGSPVINAKVNIKIYRQLYWRPWWYWSDYAWFYKSFAPNHIRDYGQKELVTEQSGELDKDGKFHYEITAPSKQNDDYIYIISADVTDNSRSTITGESNVYVTRGSFSITTSPERYFVQEGKPVVLRINTADFAARPVNSDFRIVINYPDLRGNNTSYTHPASDTLTGSTDTLGKSAVTFLPRILVNGNFKYTVYAKDEKGRLITASSSFYVGNVNYYYYGRSENGLEIVTDKDSYDKGDSLTAFIFFPQTNMDVLVSYESKDFIGYKVYHINKNSLTVKLKLTSEYAPSFNIDVTYFKDNQLQHTSKMIGVLDKDKFLTITAKPSKKIYKPGGKVTYGINVKDINGRPVKNVDLSFGVVDESIYSIKEDDTPDIKTFYYAPQYSVIPTYSSLQNNNYNGVSRYATILDLKTKYENISPEGTGNLFGKLTSKKGQVKFGKINLLLSGDKYFYRIDADTSGKYQFNNIKQGKYKIFLLFNDNGVLYSGEVNIQDQTFKNIDLSDYSNNYPFPEPIRPLLRSTVRNSAAVEKSSSQMLTFSSTDASGAQSFVQPTIRNKFADAAFWSSDIITDINGNAEVSFVLPDNLTTWRTTLRGITGNTLVGQDTNKIISRKDLLIRLETPRFFREGDELILSTIVHNYLKIAKEVRVSLNPGNLKLTGSRINQPGYDTTWGNQNKKIYDINLDNGSEVRIDWRVKVVNPIGESELEASALTNEESDAVQVKIPIWPLGEKIDEPVVADYTSEKGSENLSFTIPDNVDLRTARFSLSVSPSLAGTMLKALDDLVGYPYGCVEQTMSRFLPTIIVANTFRAINAPLNANVLQELPKMVDAGLKRLYSFQHSDGGWGWWTNDKTNPYMTAYVIYGLTLANKAGIYIDSAVFNIGLTSLENQIKDDGHENFTTSAYMIYVLTSASKNHLNKQLYLSRIEDLLKEKLNSYALSLLALSLNNLGYNVPTSEVLKRLTDSAVQESNYVYWGGKAWHYSWHDDKVQSTAFAVKALLLRDNNYKIVSKAVRWLLLQKHGFSWQSTQETATVLFALTDFLKHTNELTPNFNIAVYMNNIKILDKNFAKADVFNDQPSISINGLTDKTLHHGVNKLVIIKNGPGTAYFSGVNEYYTEHPDNEITPVFNVSRNYYLLKPENQGDKIVYAKHKIRGRIKSGDILLVKTHVETREKGLQYFILEDMFPSGFEAVKDQSKYEIEVENIHSNNYVGMRPWTWFYADKEYRDDRVSFFVTNVKNEMDFSYIIRAEIPGDFNVSPAQGYLMYYPEISGNSSPYSINVGE